MQKFLHLIISIVIVSCHGQSQNNNSTIDPNNLSWLEGMWERTNLAEGKSGHERWVKSSVEDWQGWGISMNGADTSFVEKIKIIKRNSDLFYVAEIEENPEPVYFKFTRLTSNGFLCENPDHDFPKKIEYIKNGNSLTVNISGNGESIPYQFIKRD